MITTPVDMISTLPDSILLEIASYCTAPDMHHLSQTTSLFHRSSNELSMKHLLSPLPVDADAGASNVEAVPKPKETRNVVNNLASKMLQQTLVIGLVQVLKESNAKLSLEQTRKLANLMASKKDTNGILLSGSCMVQAATGKRFNKDEGGYDIDIYCNAKSLPDLRDLLVDFGLCCESVIPFYSSIGAQDKAISHVETYVINPNSTYFTTTVADIVNRHADNAHVEMGDLSNAGLHRLRRNDLLSLLQLTEGLKHLRFRLDFPVTIYPKLTGAKAIDIIVCSDNHTPMSVVGMFDLEICKSTFNGHKFNVVSPQMTYNFHTDADSMNELLNRYMSYYLNPPNESMRREVIHSCKQTINRPNEMMTMHLMSSFLSAFLEQGGTATTIPHLHRYKKFTQEYFVCLHNFLVMRLKRALKYMSRGIAVPIDNDIIINLLGKDALEAIPKQLTPAKRRRKL